MSRYDGPVFQHLTKQDGQASDTIQEILQDNNGDVWITTEGGISRYRLSRTPPSIRLTDVVADRRYGPVREIHLSAFQLLAFRFLGGQFKASVSSDQQLLAFEFQGGSFKTRWRGMIRVGGRPGSTVWNTRISLLGAIPFG